MKTIGVVGAGTMGRGVAQVFSEYGYQVILYDISQEALNNAHKEIFNISRFRGFQTKKSNLDTPEVIVSRIQLATEITELKNVDFIVENVVENIEVKRNVYEELDLICNSDTIFAANTSCISITKLGAYTKRVNKIIGIHFMNPVAMIPAVEVIKGFHTDENTVGLTLSLLNSIDKESIVIGDYPGFVSNRISHLMMNEAAFIIQDDYATPEAIDAIFKKCYGHKMGPLETADLIGLDTVSDSLNVLFDSYKDSKYRCCPLINKMIDAGLTGRKSGEGFYKY